jgi:hypothetical protein
MKDWEFLQDSKRRWYWHATKDDDTQALSHQAFDSRAACVADAIKHGYEQDSAAP